MGDYRLERLSNHFCKRWKERVSNGVMPKKEVICQVIEEGILIQPYRVLYSPLGEREVILASFWHPALNVVISMDKRTGTAVSVLSENNVKTRPKQKKKKKVRYNPKKPASWPGIRHIKRNAEGRMLNSKC